MRVCVLDIQCVVLGMSGERSSTHMDDDGKDLRLSTLETCCSPQADEIAMTECSSGRDWSTTASCTHTCITTSVSFLSPPCSEIMQLASKVMRKESEGKKERRWLLTSLVWVVRLKWICQLAEFGVQMCHPRGASKRREWDWKGLASLTELLWNI